MICQNEIIEDKLPFEVDFLFSVNDLQTKAEILQWYIEMNSGGTPHTSKEIERVKKLLDQEKQREQEDNND